MKDQIVTDVKKGVGKEKNIQDLCKQVLNISPIYLYDSFLLYENICPFCKARTYQEEHDEMSNIEHNDNCAYLLAKKIFTNNK